MEYKEFKTLIESLTKAHKRYNLAYKLNIDLMEFVDPYDSIITTLFKEVFGKEGEDWISWYVYEKLPSKNKLKAWDNGKEICKNIKGLYKLMK